MISMAPQSELLLYGGLLLTGFNLLSWGITGVVYPARRGGHHYRNPRYLKSKVTRICFVVSGLVLLVCSALKWRLFVELVAKFF